MSIAVITGSNSGIGASIRKRLEGQGFKVVGIDLCGQEVAADLSNSKGRQNAIAQTLKLADGKIDRLVLAAGVGGHLDDGQLVTKVNFYGVTTLLDGFKDALAVVGGRVVVVSSNSAQMGVDPGSDIIKELLDGTEETAMTAIGNAPGPVTYGQSKHALTRAVRRRSAGFAKAGISLNAIAPGQTATPLYQGAADHPVIGKSVDAIPLPMKRVASPDEIAGVIEFMLSDAADYMQGSMIYVDGGTDAFIRPDSF